jgi:hypothetical protein
MAGDTEDESQAFWEAYRLLGDCYKADLERLRGRRPSGADAAAAPPVHPVPPETPEAPKTKLRGLGREAVDDDLARLQGHKLQQVLFSRAGDLDGNGRNGSGVIGQ